MTTLADIRAQAKAGKLKPATKPNVPSASTSKAAPAFNISGNTITDSPSKADPLASVRASLKSGKSTPATSSQPTPEQLKTGRYPSQQSKLEVLKNLPLLERIERLEKLTHP